MLPAFGYGSSADSWFEPRNASCVNACMGRIPALPYVECCARRPAKRRTGGSSIPAVGCEELACPPPPKLLLIFVPLSWVFPPDSGLAAHPGQTDGAPVPASGHHDAAHHGERAPSAGREAPPPAPVGTAPAVLGGSRYPLVPAQSQTGEGSAFSSR